MVLLVSPPFPSASQGDVVYVISMALAFTHAPSKLSFPGVEKTIGRDVQAEEENS